VHFIDAVTQALWLGRALVYSVGLRPFEYPTSTFSDSHAKVVVRPAASQDDALPPSTSFVCCSAVGDESSRWRCYRTLDQDTEMRGRHFAIFYVFRPLLIFSLANMFVENTGRRKASLG